jgi:hypothetical protein
VHARHPGEALLVAHAAGDRALPQLRPGEGPVLPHQELQRAQGEERLHPHGLLPRPDRRHRRARARQAAPQLRAHRGLVSTSGGGARSRLESCDCSKMCDR